MTPAEKRAVVRAAPLLNDLREAIRIQSGRPREPASRYRLQAVITALIGVLKPVLDDALIAEYQSSTDRLIQALDRSQSLDSHYAAKGQGDSTDREFLRSAADATGRAFAQWNEANRRFAGILTRWLDELGSRPR